MQFKFEILTPLCKQLDKMKLGQQAGLSYSWWVACNTVPPSTTFFHNYNDRSVIIDFFVPFFQLSNLWKINSSENCCPCKLDKGEYKENRTKFS